MSWRSQHREVSPGYLGKLRTRPRQWGSTGQPTDWRRKLANAECLPLPSGTPERVSALYCRSGEEGLGGIPGRLLLTRQRQHPSGASGLVGDPTPNDPRSYSNTLLPTLYIRASEHRWGRRQGQEVSRAERAEREERPARLTSCPCWTLAPPFGLVTGHSSQSCAAAGRPNLRCPVGALGVSP